MGSDLSPPPTPESIPTVSPALHSVVAALVATAPGAALACDAAGTVIAANAAAAALLGASHPALHGQPLADLGEPLAAALGDAATLAPGAKRQFECTLRRTGGATVAVDVHVARPELPGPALTVWHLRRRDQQLAVFLDSNPAACFQKDRDGRYQLANASCAAVLGMDPSACIGKTDFELFPRAQADAFRERDRGVLESGQVASARITVPEPSGARQVLLHKFPIRDAGGAIVGVAGIASDVTEHEAVSDRLRLRDQQLAIFVDNSPAACFQKGLDGRYQLMNATCAALYGREPSDCIGKTDYELNPAGAEVFITNDRATLARGDVHVAEEAIPSATGMRHFLTHKFPIRDASGAIISIAGTAVEITEIRRAEGVVREAEARLRAIVQGMPVLLDAFDDQGLLVAWNSECERVTGYRAEEIIGNPRALELLYPDPAYLQAMMTEADDLRNEEYSRTYELTAKDGSQKSIEWFNVGARLKIPGWLEWSVGIDITERRRLEAALHEAAVHEQRRLGHDLHDGLGQELTGLSLLASSLAKRHAAGDPELAAELAALAEIAANAIGTCKSVARGLAPVDEPTRGLGDALRRLAAGFPHAGGGIVVSFEEESTATPQITLEACNHVYRIAQEALTNAVRHSGARHVRVELRTDAQRLRLRVSDDGQGLPEPGTTAAGMGLRTMRHRATAIGARLSIAAGRHGGTVITCDCPNRAALPRRRA
jgi:PAS domain S-box-containing protein